MGSDTAEKIELATQILGKAEVVVVDSVSQSETRGEVYQAVRSGTIRREKVIELGKVIADAELGRTSPTQITIADLTGVAVQDLMIAKAVYEGV